VDRQLDIGRGGLLRLPGYESGLVLKSDFFDGGIHVLRRLKRYIGAEHYLLLRGDGGRRERSGEQRLDPRDRDCAIERWLDSREGTANGGPSQRGRDPRALPK
jgi:hypothetical protein